MVSQLYLKNELSYEVSFFACGKGSVEVTHFFNHFKWVWSDFHRGMVSREGGDSLPIADGTSKILGGGLNDFGLQQTFMVMNCKFL